MQLCSVSITNLNCEFLRKCYSVWDIAPYYFTVNGLSCDCRSLIESDYDHYNYLVHQVCYWLGLSMCLMVTS